MTKYIKKTAGTLALPVLMFLIMLVCCRMAGKPYYGTWMMWRSILADVALSASCALGIGLQFRNGRLDFSGGAIVLLSAILAGNLAKSAGSSAGLFLGLCLLFCIVLSAAVAALYVFGRLPVIIATIGAALLFEAVTCLIYNGGGINLVANMSLKVFSTYPLCLLPLGAAIAAYAIYGHLTVAGKKAALLANNQQAAVNIGISERRSVFISYLFSGFIFGCATSVYASTGLHAGAFSSLSTVGDLFNNILPVFIGLLLGGFCEDTVGVLVGALTLSLMSFGFGTIFSAEMGAALTTILTAVFLLLINVAGSKGHLITGFLKRQFAAPGGRGAKNAP